MRNRECCIKVLLWFTAIVLFAANIVILIV